MCPSALVSQEKGPEGETPACRAERYWEGRVDLDLVAPDPDDPKGLLVAEVKWRQLSVVERDAVRRNLETRWEHCSLRAKYRRVRFDVLDASILRPGPDSGRSGGKPAQAEVPAIAKRPATDSSPPASDRRIVPTGDDQPAAVC